VADPDAGRVAALRVVAQAATIGLLVGVIAVVLPV